MTIGIAIVGYGHIARHQHVPAILSDPAFQLVGVATPEAVDTGPVPRFATAEALLDALSDRVDAVAVCTPPAARHAVAAAAIARGKAVLLEKPTAATLGEAEALCAMAKAANTVLFTAWHSAYAPAVSVLRALFADDPPMTMAISWAEDVRQWHPGQQWIWQPGGFGVFDAGINALAIAHHILAEPLLLDAARLFFPANRHTPVAAELAFRRDGYSATFDWRATEKQRWLMDFATASGLEIRLSDGGHRLAIRGQEVSLTPQEEYPALYRHFAQLVLAGTSAVDVAPLRLVADAFLIGSRETVEPFA